MAVQKKKFPPKKNNLTDSWKHTLDTMYVWMPIIINHKEVCANQLPQETVQVFFFNLHRLLFQLLFSVLCWLLKSQYWNILHCFSTVMLYKSVTSKLSRQNRMVVSHYIKTLDFFNWVFQREIKVSIFL